MSAEQIEAWFDRLETRLGQSSLSAQDWLRQGVEQLRRQKAQLYREESETAPRYHRLCADAERLLQRVQACEGPTEVAWLNEPLRNARAFLAGSESLDCGAQFESAYQRLRSLEVGEELEQLAHQLMLWSGGHLALGPRDLGVKLDEFVAAALAEEDRILADAWTLETLLTGYLRSGSEELWELWESQLVAMLGELAMLAEQGVDVQQLRLETEALRQCPRDQEELWEQLERVRQEWATVSQLLSLEAVRHREGPGLQHLDRLRYLAAEFQQGTLDLEDFHYEIEVHNQRLTGAMPHLWQLWAEDEARLAQLAELQKALQDLSQVTRPGDLRLGALTQSYCDLLLELESSAR